MSKSEFLAILPTLSEHQLLSIEHLLRGSDAPQATPSNQPQVPVGMIKACCIDGDVFMVRRLINQARCIMDDVMDDYFHKLGILNDVELAHRAFKTISLKAEILDDLLNQMDKSLEPVEAAIDKADSLPEEVSLS